MSTELDDVRREVAIANRMLFELGLATGPTISLGHASMRLPSEPDKFVVKGRGYAIDALASMQPEQMVTVDLEGYKVGGPPATAAAGEIKMHSCLYKMYPEVQSVVHVHPRFTIVMGLIEATIKPMSHEGNKLVRDPLPVYPHQRLIITEEHGMAVAGLMGTGKAVLLRGHGAVVTGASLEESVMNMVALEEQAKLNWYAYCAVGRDYPSVSAEQVDEWHAEGATASQLPHHKAAMADIPASKSPFGSTAPAGGRGAWQYYADVVQKGM